MALKPPILAIFLAAWLVTLVVAYFVGYQSIDESALAEGQPAATEANDSQFAAQADEPGLVGNAQAVLLGDSLEGAEPAEATGLPSFSTVFTTFKEDTSNATARQQIGIMLQSLPYEDLDQARELIGSLPPGAARDQLTLQLTERWAELDPYGALEYAQSLPTLQLSESATNRALTGWAKSDPQSALAWWKSGGNQGTGRISNQRFEA
ncbi:MAG: hypothetical protein AAGA45_04140, partial [Verrucomicrobiota bacterium]